MVMASPLPFSKWAKHELLLACPELQPHLPATRRFDVAALPSWLDAQRAIIIKPEWGEGGLYVCKISKRAGGYFVHTGTRTQDAANVTQLMAGLPPWTTTKACIMQRLIHLKAFHRRPTDIRTIVQRNERGRFELTGTFVKIAPPLRFVTNVKQGGTIARTDLYLRQALANTTRRQQVQDTIWKVSERIGAFLGERFDNAVYGIDLGLDQSGHIWIIEVNTQPNLGILGELDTAMRRRALSLRRYNRRHAH